MTSMVPPTQRGTTYQPRLARLTDARELDAACLRLRAAQATVGDDTQSRDVHRHLAKELSPVEARQRLRALAAELDAHRFGLAGPREP